MTIAAFISFVICVLIIASTFRRGADVFSPARVFGLIWSLAIGLAEFKLSGLQQEWSVESWIQLLVGPISFIIGLFAVYVVNLNSQLLPVDEVRRKCRQLTINKQRLFNLILLFFFLFVFAYVVMVLSGREIPLFSSKPGQARLRFQMFGIGLFIHNLVLIVFFSSVYYLVVSGERAKKRLLISASVVSVLMWAITLQRFPFAVPALLLLTVLYYATHHLRLSTVALYASVGTAFIFAVSTFRMSVVLLYFVYVQSKMKIAPQFALLTEPYMYIVMNLEMFARSIDRLDHFTFGYYTFDFVTALTGLKHWVSDYFTLNETPYLISGYNTYTAFWTYYRDFGVIGVFVIGLIGGLMIGSVYYSLRREPRLSNLTGYSVAVFLMVLSFFNAQTGFLWFVYNVVLLYITVRLVETRHNHNLPKHDHANSGRLGSVR
jgi:oligosaccharide repeat unit polymerase